MYTEGERERGNDMKHWNNLLDTDIQKWPAAIEDTKVFAFNIHTRNLYLLLNRSLQRVRVTLLVLFSAVSVWLSVIQWNLHNLISALSLSLSHSYRHFGLCVHTHHKKAIYETLTNIQFLIWQISIYYWFICFSSCLRALWGCVLFKMYVVFFACCRLKIRCKRNCQFVDDVPTNKYWLECFNSITLHVECMTFAGLICFCSTFFIVV